MFSRRNNAVSIRSINLGYFHMRISAFIISVTLIALAPAALAENGSAPASGRLWAAISLADAEAVTQALAAGADPNTRDPLTQMTPLMAASSEEVARSLLVAGADLSATDRGGLSPLHYAVRTEIPEPLVALLIAHGAELNAPSNDAAQMSPLHFAVEAVVEAPDNIDRQRTLAALVQAGADIAQPAARGETPTTMAKPCRVATRILLAGPSRRAAMELNARTR